MNKADILAHIEFLSRQLGRPVPPTVAAARARSVPVPRTVTPVPIDTPTLGWDTLKIPDNIWAIGGLGNIGALNLALRTIEIATPETDSVWFTPRGASRHTLQDYVKWQEKKFLQSGTVSMEDHMELVDLLSEDGVLFNGAETARSIIDKLRVRKAQLDAGTIALEGWEEPAIEAPTRIGGYRPSKGEQKEWGLGWKSLYLPESKVELPALDDFELLNLALRLCDVTTEADGYWHKRGKYRSTKCEFFTSLTDKFAQYWSMLPGARKIIYEQLDTDPQLWLKTGAPGALLERVTKALADRLGGNIPQPTALQVVQQTTRVIEGGGFDGGKVIPGVAEAVGTLPITDARYNTLSQLLARAGMDADRINQLTATAGISSGWGQWNAADIRAAIDIARACVIQVDPAIQNMLHGKKPNGQQVTRSLTGEQIALCYHAGGLGVVDAVAGSGKSTSVLARAYALAMTGLDPRRICIVSYTNAAVADLKRGWQEKYCSKFGQLPMPHISTIHSLGRSIANAVGLAKPPDLKESVVKPAYMQEIRKAGAAFLETAKGVDQSNTEEMAEYVQRLLLYGYRLKQEYDGTYNLDELKAPRDPKWEAAIDTIHAIGYYEDLCPGASPASIDDKAFRMERDKYGLVSAPLAPVGTARIAGDSIMESPRTNMVTFRYMISGSAKAMFEGRVRMNNAFDVVILDEAQDVSPLQLAFICYLTGVGKRRVNLMLVGDADGQSIMGFQAGRPELMHGLQAMPSAIKYTLTTNFRCSDTIVKAGGRLICRPEEHASDDARARAVSDIPIVAQDLGSLRSEAEFVVDQIDALLTEWRNAPRDEKADADVKPEDIAILYRTKTRAAIPQLVLGMRNIPHVIEKGTSFWNAKALEVALNYMQFVTSTDANEIAELFLQLMNRPFRGFSTADVTDKHGQVIMKGIDARQIKDRLHQADGSLLGILQKSKWPEKLATNVDSFRRDITNLLHVVNDIPEMLVKMAEFENCVSWSDNYKQPLSADGDETWIEVWKAMSEGGSLVGNIFAATQQRLGKESGCAEFIDRIEQLRIAAANAVEQLKAAKEAGETLPMVMLTTTHSSKGREWKYVYVVGWERDLFPHKRTLAQDSGDAWGVGEAEERRLGYVAVTRAKKALTLTCGRPVPKALRIQGISTMISIYTDPVLGTGDIQHPAGSMYQDQYTDWIKSSCPWGEAPFVVRPKEVE